MPKRNISAKELVQDVKMGLSYLRIKNKYALSDGNLDNVLIKLVSSNLVDYDEIPDKPPLKCPRCSAPKRPEQKFCPGCSEILDLFKEQAVKPTITLRNLTEDIKAQRTFEDIRFRHQLSKEDLSALIERLWRKKVLTKVGLPRGYELGSSQGVGVLEDVGREQSVSTSKMETDISSLEPVCPKCGEKLAGNAKFCGECGFQAASSEAVIAGPSPTEVRNTPKLQTQYTCPACGATHSTQFDECPTCHVLVSRYRTKMEVQARAEASRADSRRKWLVAGAVLVSILAVAVLAYFLGTGRYNNAQKEALNNLRKEFGRAVQQLDGGLSLKDHRGMRNSFIKAIGEVEVTGAFKINPSLSLGLYAMREHLSAAEKLWYATIVVNSGGDGYGDGIRDCVRQLASHPHIGHFDKPLLEELDETRPEEIAKRAKIVMQKHWSEFKRVGKDNLK